MRGVERAAEAALLLAVAAAVAGYGGAEPVWFAAVELLLFAVGVAVLVRLPGSKLVSLPWMPLLVVGVVLLQLLPLGEGAISVAPDETRAHLLRLATYLVAFYLAVLLAARAEARSRLVAGLVGIGTLAALYGLAQYVSAHSLDYDATGPYINRNHFAGLLEMLLPLALALVFVRGAAGSSRGAGLRGWLTHPAAQKVVLPLAAAVLLSSALLFSRSRMGLISTLLAVGLMGLLWKQRGQSRGPLPVVALVVVLGSAAAFSLWIGVAPVLARFEGTAFADPGRPPIWSDTVRLIGDNLWLGTGWGTFALAYPAVQTAHLNALVAHAHNDYLEHTAELGLPGALLLWGGIGTVFVRTLRALLRRGGGQERLWLWGCAGSLTAILLHSLTDFNLYLPANALVFSLVLGLAYVLAREGVTAHPAAPART